MVVAEASGEHEQRDQLPLRSYAAAGGVFERAIRRMGLSRQMFSITNCVRCRPKGNWLEGAWYEYSALRHCRPNLDAALAERKPKVILALGGVALRELTGLSGEKLGISYLTGYPLPTIDGTPVIGGFHPSYLRQGHMSHVGHFMRVIQRALNIASGKDHQWVWGIDPDDIYTWEGLQYVLHPALDHARALRNHILDNPNLVIAEDIETPESALMDEDAREGFVNTEIRQVQFSIGKGHGMAMPWEGEYRQIALDIINSSNPKYGHNWAAYDHKVVRAACAREGLTYAPRGMVLDTLDMFHHWQPDLPAHLQFASSFINFPFPWKHLHTIEHEPFYGCVDVDSDWQLGEFLVRVLKQGDLWGDDTRGYLGQVYEVRPVLTRMEERGVPIDDTARLKLGAEFKIASEELAQVLMARYPESAKKLDAYKTFPPELKKLPEDEWGKLFREPDKLDKKGNIKPGKWYRYGQREVDVPALGTDGNPTTERMMRWCYIPEFNPNSGPQVIEYMKVQKHKVPKDKHKEDAEGNQKDTTAAKELQRLANHTGDDFYLKVIEYRGFSKLRGTYIDGFVPHADGCVHTTFTFDTSIGQLSSRNPNVQNFTKLKPTPQLADAMRAMVAAKDGYLISEWDFKSCHALTLGFLAESERYMRLARLDIHSFTAGHFLRCWDGNKIIHESDEALMERFAWLKSDPERKRVRDDQAKHAILGIGNGLKAKGLYERYLESFPGPGGMKTAQKFLDILERELFPEVFDWQRRMQKLAHEQQFLKTEFGHIRRFYEVFRWDGKKGCWGHGDQAEQAISFWLSNIAFGHIREGLKQLHRTGVAEKYGLMNNVHDSYLFHYPRHLHDEHVADVYPILIAPSKVLKHPRICPDGLVIGVEASAGVNWAPQNMHKIKLGTREAVHA